MHAGRFQWRIAALRVWFLQNELCTSSMNSEPLRVNFYHLHSGIVHCISTGGDEENVEVNRIRHKPTTCCLLAA